MYEYLHLLCLLLVSAEFAIIRQNISNIKIIVVFIYIYLNMKVNVYEHYSDLRW